MTTFNVRAPSRILAEMAMRGLCNGLWKCVRPLTGP